jgi:hypothetical protein
MFKIFKRFFEALYVTADSENLDMCHFKKRKKRPANKKIPSESVFFALPVVSQ